MERKTLHGIDQPHSLYKSHIRNTNPNMEPYYSFSPSKGLLKAPPLSLLHSAPSSLQPPPLLPLPTSLPRRTSSCPAPAVKISTRRPRDQKKLTKSSTSKNNITIPKKEEKIPPNISSVALTSTTKFGPDTKVLPKKIARVARFDDSVKDDVIRDRVDLLMGSVMFAVSPPPPSSLPLPTFSLRPKLSCNEAAAGIDASATDDLRRLLRLQ